MSKLELNSMTSYTFRMLQLPGEFTNLEVIRANQRYETYRAIYENSSVFIKHVVDRHRISSSIDSEIRGLEIFHELSKKGDLGFDIPQVITRGDDYVVTTWIDGDLVSFDPESANFDDVVEFFATSLANIDMLTMPGEPIPPKFGADSEDGKASVDKLHTRMVKVDYASYFNPELIESAFKFVYDNLPVLTARLTHADFTPGNVIEHGGRRTLIDFESVGEYWPRFYDLVNLTQNKIITNPATASGCKQMVKRYFEVNQIADLETCLPQLKILALWRCLSLIWEHLSKPSHAHNTHQNMSPELSERLTQSIEQILQGKAYFEIFQN